MAYRMNEQQARQVLAAGTHTGKLATVRADGSPHVAPAWLVLDGDDLSGEVREWIREVVETNVTNATDGEFAEDWDLAALIAQMQGLYGTDITVEELNQLIESGQAPFVLDVRNPEEFQICRIPGTTLLPLPELPQRHGELDKARAMIVHCKSGMRSAKAIAFLRQQGFTKLRNLKGGIMAWADRVDPAMPKY